MLWLRIRVQQMGPAAIALALFGGIALAEDLDQVGRAAVDRFLEQRKASLDEGEEATLQAAAMTDFDRDETPEIAMVWTTLGPTYWRNTLSVLVKRDGEYRDVASVPLDGEARLSSVNTDGTIVVELKAFAANDPRCCPSLLQMRRFRYFNGVLTSVGG